MQGINIFNEMKKTEDAKKQKHNPNTEELLPSSQVFLACAFQMFEVNASPACLYGI